MLGCVHACIGAAVGSLFKRKPAAFAGGVVSHVVADLIPHTDFDPKIDVPIAAAIIAGIAKFKGVDSPEFWGAIGAVAPDSEHALLLAGLIGQDDEIFPTHGGADALHGRETHEQGSQILIAAAALAVVAIVASRDMK